MTHEQYISIYERERKKSNVIEAAHVVFKALHREITYKVEQKNVRLIDALKYANTVWQIIANKHQELKSDGFKNMTMLLAKKNGDAQLEAVFSRLFELL